MMNLRAQTHGHHVSGPITQNIILGIAEPVGMRMSECDYEHEMFCDSLLDVLTETITVEGISFKLSPCLEKSHKALSRKKKF